MSDYLARAPGDVESAERAVAPYRDMTPDERWLALAELLREVDQLLGGRPPAPKEDEEPLWRLGMDPSLGRPS